MGKKTTECIEFGLNCGCEARFRVRVPLFEPYLFFERIQDLGEHSWVHQLSIKLIRAVYVGLCICKGDSCALVTRNYPNFRNELKWMERKKKGA